jgi:FKBP-type peptidyl-prolyl cis-trans isomerase
VTPLPNPDNDPNLRTTIPDLNAPGWVAHPDGLRVRDRIVGTGPAVIAGSTVTVEYIGWLKDTGVKFDASADHGGTSQFSLDQVIVGWQEGVPGMQPGGIRDLDVPAALAYGAAGFPPNVSPNADLVFEIKMISSP